MKMSTPATYSFEFVVELSTGLDHAAVVAIAGGIPGDMGG